MLKDAEKCRERAPEALKLVNPSPPVFHYYAVNRSGHQKSDMRYHLAHLCDYLQTCQGPCDCKPLNHELRMCANIVHVFACRSRELLHSKLPSSHNQPSSTPKIILGEEARRPLCCSKWCLLSAATGTNPSEPSRVRL